MAWWNALTGGSDAFQRRFGPITRRERNAFITFGRWPMTRRRPLQAPLEGANERGAPRLTRGRGGASPALAGVGPPLMRPTESAMRATEERKIVRFVDHSRGFFPVRPTEGAMRGRGYRGGEGKEEGDGGRRQRARLQRRGREEEGDGGRRHERARLQRRGGEEEGDGGRRHERAPLQGRGRKEEGELAGSNGSCVGLSHGVSDERTLVHITNARKT